MTQPQVALASVWRFLGLDDAALDIDVESEAETFHKHGTAKSPEESIGRWRGKMSKEDLAAVDRDLGSFIERFGYPAA